MKTKEFKEALLFLFLYAFLIFAMYFGCSIANGQTYNDDELMVSSVTIDNPVTNVLPVDFRLKDYMLTIECNIEIRWIDIQINTPSTYNYISKREKSPGKTIVIMPDDLFVSGKYSIYYQYKTKEGYLSPKLIRMIKFHG